MTERRKRVAFKRADGSTVSFLAARERVVSTKSRGASEPTWPIPAGAARLRWHEANVEFFGYAVERPDGGTFNVYWTTNPKPPIRWMLEKFPSTKAQVESRRLRGR